MVPTYDGRPVLLTPETIVSIHNHPDGIEVTYRLADGGLGRWVTGARRVARAARRGDPCDC
ncbi:MAG TPA: hypothetical protein VFK42_08955 [Acidimicrobiales bacterium]|jgi:hypothetical protein|nr:hypothetical protein [Acidimicrobiales bacterium]